MTPLHWSHVRAALILAAMLVVFFWTPLTSDGYLAPVDILEEWPVMGGKRPAKNPVMADVVLQMIPFVEWNKAELSQGRIPLWNPYSAWGAPHLANAQSAVFSPFTLPFYLFDWRAALLLSNFAKLFCAGFFTYLFLRQLGLSLLAALTGGTLFMFSGYNTVWLLWHNGAIAATLPASAYWFERCVRQPDRWGPRAGLSIALAVGLLAGHPETFFFVGVAFAIWAVFRLASDPSLRTQWPRHAAWITVCGIVAACLSAIQVIPFLEYIVNSAEHARKGVRHEGMPHLNWTSLVLQLCPDLFGNQTTPMQHRAMSNYNELNSAYMGVGAYFLLSLSILTWPFHRRRETAFFAALFAVWFVYVHDFFNLYPTILYKLPIIGLAIPKRSAVVGLFCAAALVALLVDWLSEERPASNRLSLVTGVWSAVLWGFIMTGFFWNLNRMFLGSFEARAVVGWRLGVMTVSLLMMMAWCMSRAAGFAGPRWFAALLPALVFAQTGLMLRDYSPTVAAPTVATKDFFPQPALFREMRDFVGKEQAVWENTAGMYSAANTWYRLRLTSNYDAIGVDSFTRLANGVFRYATARSLQLLGVKYVVTADPVSGKARADVLPRPLVVTRTPLSGRVFQQSIWVGRDRINGVKTPFAAGPVTDGCIVRVTVADEKDGRIVVRNDLPCRDMVRPDLHWQRFPEILDSSQHRYRVTVDGTRVGPRDDIGVFTTPDWTPEKEHETAKPGAPHGLIVEAASGFASALKVDWEKDGYLIWGVKDALPRFHSVGRASHAKSPDEIPDRLMHPAFDYQREVILMEPPEGPQSDEMADGTLIEETPVRARVVVERKTPGWLLALNPWYPGWRAYVNGEPRRLLRANGGFVAVPVAAGKSEIVLAYEPGTVKLGAALSILGLAGVCFMAAMAKRSAMRQ